MYPKTFSLQQDSFLIATPLCSFDCLYAHVSEISFGMVVSGKMSRHKGFYIMITNGICVFTDSTS